MPIFEIAFIREGKIKDYFDYWDRGIQVNQAGESLNDHLVGFVELIEAMSLSEAIIKAKQRFPADSVCEPRCRRLG